MTLDGAMLALLLIPLALTLTLAITAQILWTRHQRKKRRGFPVAPPSKPDAPP